MHVFLVVKCYLHNSVFITIIFYYYYILLLLYKKVLKKLFARTKRSKKVVCTL